MENLHLMQLVFLWEAEEGWPPPAPFLEPPAALSQLSQSMAGLGLQHSTPQSVPKQGRNLSCLGWGGGVGGWGGSPDFQPPGHGLPPAKSVNIRPQPTQVVESPGHYLHPDGHECLPHANHQAKTIPDTVAPLSSHTGPSKEDTVMPFSREETELQRG